MSAPEPLQRTSSAWVPPSVLNSISVLVKEFLAEEQHDYEGQQPKEGSGHPYEHLKLVNRWLTTVMPPGPQAAASHSRSQRLQHTLMTHRHGQEVCSHGHDDELYDTAIAPGHHVVEIPNHEWPAARPEECSRDHPLVWLDFNGHQAPDPEKQIVLICSGCGLDVTPDPPSSELF